MGIQVNTEIELGWRVKDAITGFVGIATSYGKFLNGCERIGVTPETLKDGKVLETEYFDVQQLVVMDRSPKLNAKVKGKKGGKDPGGPYPAPTRAADPR